MREDRADELKEQIISEPTPPKGPCPLCGDEPAQFRRHDKRPRSWWLNRAGVVLHIFGWICRYICPTCKKRFTHQPDYSIANKRYVREEVEGVTVAYLEKECATLFSTLRDEQVPMHEEPFPPAQESFTACSTVWRWTEWFGNMKDRLGKLRRWILEADPSTKIGRLVRMIAPHKAHTPTRKERLLVAWELLDLTDGMRRLRIAMNSP